MCIRDSCNDGDNSIYPDATEVCNFIDDDCDGTADDGITYLIYYTDADLDAYGAGLGANYCSCLLYTSPSPRDRTRYRMPSSA